MQDKSPEKWPHSQSWGHFSGDASVPCHPKCTLVILRYAQDDKRVLSIQIAFW